MNAFSSGVLNLSLPRSKRLLISGRYLENASKIVFTFQTNKPEFQKNSPLSINTFANSRFGFSVKVFTLVKSSTTVSLLWIYPYPVSGRLGLMPKVTNARFLFTKSNAFERPQENILFKIRWSEGATTILASGLHALI